MKAAEKADCVRASLGQLALTEALELFDLPRSTWFYQKSRQEYEQRHSDLVAPLLEATTESPEYGYRRMASELSERLDRPVNAKVVRRLNQVLGLTPLRKPKSPKKSVVRQTIEECGDRANLVAALDEIDLFHVLCTDFTEIWFAKGKAVLMPILDHHSKDILGWDLGHTANTELALRAWKRARARLHRLGISLAGIIMHHDRDSVYTSEQWVRTLLLRDGLRLSYALRGAPDNPEMESWNGRFKTENQDLFAEARTFEELRQVVSRRILYYCRKRRHSTLENATPRDYVKWRLEEE